MKIIVIGAVAAGTSAAAKARRTMPEADIIVYEKNSYISYSGCSMPYFIGPVIDDLKSVVPRDAESFEASRQVNIQTGYEVLAIDRAAKTVTVKDPQGHLFKDSYDRLILATGARAFVPPLEGVDLSHVFSLRTVEDMLAIDDFITVHEPRSVAIIGSGFIGIEMAENLKMRGLDVSLVEAGDQVANNLDPEIAAQVEEILRAHDVQLYLSSRAEKIEPQEVHLSNGMCLPAELVILAVGVRPNVRLAEEAGLELGVGGSIAVNERLQTSDPNIFACGDCTASPHKILGRDVYSPMGSTANKTGRIAGSNAAGGHCIFQGILGSSIFKIFDHAVGQSGLTEKQARDEGYDVRTAMINRKDKSPSFGGSSLSLKAVADAETGRLLGAQVFGKSGVDKRVDVIACALNFGAKVQDFIQLDLAYAPPFSTVRDPVHYIGMVLEKEVDA